MSVLIRPYEASDLEACRGLWVELTQRHREIYEDDSIGGDDPGAYFDGVYLKLDGLHGPWVAELDEQIVGLTGLLVHDTHGEVEPVVVTAARRSQGVGDGLVERAVREARQLGVRLLAVRPVARNHEAIAFFVRHGFEILGQIDLTRDLAETDEQRWKSGVILHGHELRY
jgi:N-acetylglutamate synthase-like GNAT family acetyltransferase